MINTRVFIMGLKDTLEEREVSYGNASQCFTQIAKRWSLTLGHEVTPQQVALCMIDLKIARLTSDNNHYDSMVDIAGYAALMAGFMEVNNDEAQR